MSDVVINVEVTQPEEDTIEVTVGAQGEQGIQGIQGETGAPGADGAPGAPGVIAVDAPSDGNQYARKNADWEQVAAAGGNAVLATAYSNAGTLRTAGSTPINVNETTHKVTFTVPDSGKVFVAFSGIFSQASNTLWLLQDDVDTGSPSQVGDTFYMNSNVSFRGTVGQVVEGLTPGAQVTWYIAVRRATSGTGYYLSGGTYGPPMFMYVLEAS